MRDHGPVRPAPETNSHMPPDEVVTGRLLSGEPRSLLAFPLIENGQSPPQR